MSAAGSIDQGLGGVATLLLSGGRNTLPQPTLATQQMAWDLRDSLHERFMRRDYARSRVKKDCRGRMRRTGDLTMVGNCPLDGETLAVDQVRRELRHERELRFMPKTELGQRTRIPADIAFVFRSLPDQQANMRRLQRLLLEEMKARMQKDAASFIQETSSVQGVPSRIAGSIQKLVYQDNPYSNPGGVVRYKGVPIGVVPGAVSVFDDESDDEVMNAARASGARAAAVSVRTSAGRGVRVAAPPFRLVAGVEDSGVSGETARYLRDSAERAPGVPPHVARTVHTQDTELGTRGASVTLGAVRAAGVSDEYDALLLIAAGKLSQVPSEELAELSDAIEIMTGTRREQLELLEALGAEAKAALLAALNTSTARAARLAPAVPAARTPDFPGAAGLADGGATPVSRILRQRGGL